jgi:hypothetical protein
MGPIANALRLPFLHQSSGSRIERLDAEQRLSAVVTGRHAGVHDQTEIHFRPNLATADAATAREAAHAHAHEQGKLFF